MSKISIRFFDDREVRAVWDEENNKWWFVAVDIAAVLSESNNPANYWRGLKNRLISENSQTITNCNVFKLKAPDGKLRVTDCFDADGIIELAKNFPNNRAMKFLDWFLYSDNTIDGQSKKKVYSLFESGLLASLEPGSINCLQQIHAYFICSAGFTTSQEKYETRISAKAVLLLPMRSISQGQRIKNFKIW
jgi:cell filamentation protein